MTPHFEKSGSKYDRLSYIYDRLSRTPDGVTIKELTQELNVSSKTIQRDLHNTLSNSGVYCDGRHWKLSRNSAEDGLVNEERIVLGILDSLAKQAGFVFYGKAHQLLEKITCQLDHPLFTSLNTETLSEEHLKIFTLLENAIKSRRLISASYVNKKKEHSNVILKPLRLAFFEGYWYLLAFDTEANDKFKKYHLKSLSDIKPLEETFNYPSEIAEKIEKAFSVWFTLEEPFEVRLWIDKTIVPYFERKPYRGQTIEGRDSDGSIVIAINATDQMEILPIVQWYLPHIRILEPKWLEEELMSKIKKYMM
jgi:predicted DNA-binding transcriptional regulator YafY